MARPLRIQTAESIYHVVSRGNGKRTVFLDDRDRARFLGLLHRTRRHYALLCLAYCLMDNHYHALFRTIDGNLSAAVQYLNGCYAQWWNRRHGTTGHLWQGRYYSQVVQETGYFHAALAYVLRNPVRAQLCRTPGEWPWSSYQASSGMNPTPEFLACDVLWQLLGSDSPASGQEMVRALVGRSDPSPGNEDPGPRALVVGDPAFVEAVAEFVRSGAVRGAPTRARLAGRDPIGNLFQDVTSRSDRDDRIRRARFEWRYSFREIGDHVGLHYSTVSKICSDVGVRP